MIMTATKLPARAGTSGELMESNRSLSPVARGARPSERGQVLVLFVLVMLTCTAIATVAVSVGQVAVRRHQAQMIVDAAAFAGAAKQAEGLNNIANLNQLSIDLLVGIYAVSFIPYIDSDGTSALRVALGAFSLVNDWAGDTLKEYTEIFDTINNGINVINRTYANPVLPQLAAEAVIDANFGSDSDKIFKAADRGSSGFANPIVDIPKNNFRLVKLTDRDTYRGHLYFYGPSRQTIQTCTNLGFPLGAICAALVAAQYASVATAVAVLREAFPIEYQTGRFYNQDEGDDVRFTYQLTVSQAPVLFGKTWFNDIPPITVVASAKPYNGYLGEKFNGGGFLGLIPPSQNEEIKETYQAKLVPVRLSDAFFVSASDPTMLLRILH